MAHTKATGAAKRNVNVPGKRLGIKKFAGEFVKPGNIIVKQRGSEFYPGTSTMQGKDFTIFAVAEGFVSFRNMSGYKRNQKYVDVLPQASAVQAEPTQDLKPAKKKAAKKEAAE
jgi:large subunit ribosomal protein L27